METSMKQHEKPHFHISADSDQIDRHASQRVRPEVVGPMTGSVAPFFERLGAGMTT